jgi:glycosyltransferase involved in cell wall biosynthesis
MKVSFFAPPAEQRVGGLDAAVNGLSSALIHRGISVVSESGGGADDADIAHFHGLWQPSFPTRARACRKRGTRIVVSPHGMLEPWAWRHKWWKKWPYYQLRERSFIRAADCILATAQSEAARLRARFPHTRVETLSLGMTGDVGPDYANARQRLGWAPEETVLLFLSRFHPKKGLDLLIEALARLPSGPGLRLVIVGGGAPSYMQELRALAKRQRASLPRIDWMGEVWGNERWQFFQGADLFCLPTHSENFGLAVLEALQVGTRVLTTKDTPWRDLARKESIFIGDASMDSVRIQLTRFLTNPKQSEAERLAVAEWTRQAFSWSDLVGSYISLYAELIKPGISRSPRMEPYT